MLEVKEEELYRVIEKETEQAYRENCEGLVVKIGSATYPLDGTNRSDWIKYKSKAGIIGDTLDLYPIAGFYGFGQRRGAFGAYLMAAYCPLGKVFYPICKTGTGMTMAVM